MKEEEKIEILNKLTKEDLIKIILDISGAIPVKGPFTPYVFPSKSYEEMPPSQQVWCCNDRTTLNN